MNAASWNRLSIAAVISIVLGLGALPGSAEAQFKKRLLQVGACGAGAFAGAKLGEKIADMQAKRLNLSPAEAAKQKRAFEIGIALALCGGGAAIAGTSYSKLSKRGQDARQKEVLAALEDAMPHTYADPDNAQLRGVATAQPTFVEGNEECRLVQDRLAPDEALVKYCRPPNGMWAVRAV
jgi:hypothetical protein